MSITSLQNSIKRIKEDIAKLNKDLSQEYKKEADKISEANRIKSSINKNSSPSTLASKMRQIESCEKAIAESKKKQSDLTKKLSEKQLLLAREQERLSKEQAAEQKKLIATQEKAMRQQKDMISNLQKQTNSSRPTYPSHVEEIDDKEYDFFISYASEDKAEIAEPLAIALQERGAKVWYDKFTLSVGDSLRKSIDLGLSRSRYGIVILTHVYFKKFWTEKELNGLFAKLAGGENKVILPIWHNISKDAITRYSPMLADIVALKSADFTIAELADELCKLII